MDFFQKIGETTKPSFLDWALNLMESQNTSLFLTLENRTNVYCANRTASFQVDTSVYSALSAFRSRVFAWIYSVTPRLKFNLNGVTNESTKLILQ